jgi:predicted CopG family antitoxin
MLKEKDYSTKSIKVSRKVHEQLTELASKNETYSDVIQKLIDSNNES